MVWSLVMAGLVAIVMTNSFIGWTISDLNQERQRLLTLDNQLTQNAQKLRRLSLQTQSQLRSQLQLDPPASNAPLPAGDFDQLRQSFLNVDQSPEMEKIMDRLFQGVRRLEHLYQNTEAWRKKQRQFLADQRQKLTLSQAREDLHQIRETLESAEGGQRLNDALLVRHWRAAQTPSKALGFADQLLARQAGAWRRLLNEAKDELMDLARMIEILPGENRADQLIDLKDNQLKPALERIGQLLKKLYAADLIDSAELPPTVLEHLQQTLFGQGYIFVKEYQTIQPGEGGLYQLAHTRLHLLQDREKLQAEIDQALQDLEGIFPELTDLTRQRSRSLAEQAAVSLGRNSANMLLLSIVTLCCFLGLGWLFARIARRQVTVLEDRDRRLLELNNILEDKVSERTALLEEKSLQLIRAQEDLLRQEKLAAIGSLAAGVAHEINNPAAIIRGNTEILQMGLALDAPEREETREILKQVERVSLITQNLLSFANKQILQEQQVELNTLLNDILAQIKHQQPLGEVRIVRQLAELPVVPGDPERLRQVFTNLVLNALQAMGRIGVLTLTTAVEDNQVVVSISDTGPGIPEEWQEKIFNPFFTTRQHGTGLGLSVSYGIVHAHDGALLFTTNQGHGSRFIVKLPKKMAN